MALSESPIPILDSPTTDVATNAPLIDQSKEALKDISFGSIAGIVGKYIEYPFDTVKVRLQSQPDHVPLKYKGPVDCFKQSLSRDGFLGLYRGISAPLFGAAVETSSLFFSYRIAQGAFQSTFLQPGQTLPFSALLLCGGASGAFTSILLTPIELIKCKMQVPADNSGKQPRLSIPQQMASVYRHQGILGFWRGQMGTFIRETGGSAAWFGSYEGVGLLLKQASSDPTGNQSLPVWQQMMAGAAAGMSYNFMFYPADTIKSRMQTEDVSKMRDGKQSFGAVGKILWRQQGLRGLYRGCGITVARSAPSSAFIFTIYETLRSHFG
ncbi:putative mitochondrial ornithine carrier protein [Pseudovirgaria hyperparasitica]|uniref:Putative mitochondrial ornithine carrier protein n=1 Tax=Pseudovirgaria hyperparasitica TaxID=470096 RepID=A0A6A6W164_9PEZI|nr:putative mitochondrial ornithine carrier protein [Pseudovirgaria hyperparasitica]KAF2756658.1 putative mitochondrial ornithine carrier protein [Pseudovirgaria hyperparasitica]